MPRRKSNARPNQTRGNNINILKLNVAVFSSLLFLLFAVVDTAAGDDYADGKLSKALILDGKSQSVKISVLIQYPGRRCCCRQVALRHDPGSLLNNSDL